jgi:hypothetical protein
MTPAQWIAAVSLATSGVEKLIQLLNWLKANQPQPDEEVTQEQLDAGNAEMNAAVAKWDAPAPPPASSAGDITNSNE